MNPVGEKMCIHLNSRITLYTYFGVYYTVHTVKTIISSFVSYSTSRSVFDDSRLLSVVWKENPI